MTLLDEPPVAAGPARPEPQPARSGSGSWRFAARLARREVRRRPGRTLLVALLVAIPVAAMVFGSVVVRTVNDDWARQFERRYGAADLAEDGHEPVALDGREASSTPELPAGTRTVEYLFASTMFTPAEATGLEPAWGVLTDIPTADPLAAGIVEFTSGRAPARGEIAIGPDIAGAWQLEVGDRIELARPVGTWTVSGIARFGASFWEQLVVVSDLDQVALTQADPAFGPGVSTVRLHDLPDDISDVDRRRAASTTGMLARDVDPFRFGFEANVAPTLAWGWVAGVLALMATGIVVAAAFATSGRRQLVTVGQLASNGATPETIHRSLALQGSWSGLAGAVVGVAVGLAALPLTHGLVERAAAHRIDGFRISPFDLVAAAVTAVVVATIAATVPARSLGRVPVLTALAGRRPAGRLPGWLVPLGVTLFAAGLALVAVAGTGARLDVDGTSSTMWALLVILGAVASVAGVCCTTPLVIDLLGRAAHRLPLAARLAARSLGRARARSSAVVAAVAVAIGVSVAAGAVADTAIAQMAADDLPFLPADVAIVERVDDAGCCVGVVDLDPLPDAPLPDSALDEIERIVPGAVVTPWRVATFDPVPVDWDDPAAYDEYVHERGNTGPWIADPASASAVFGFSDRDLAAVEAGALVRGVWSPDEARSWFEPVPTFRSELGTIEPDVRIVETRPATSFGAWALVMSADAAERAGFTIVERGVVIDAPDPLTDEQRRRIGAVANGLNGDAGTTSFRFVDDIFDQPGDPARPGPDDVVTYSGWTAMVGDDGTRSSGADAWLARSLIAGGALLLVLLVVAIGLSLAAAEGRHERDVIVAVGASPGVMRRHSTARGVVTAVVGIALGVPLGLLPTWVLFSTVFADESSIGFRFPWPVVGAVVVVVPIVVAMATWVGAAVAQRRSPALPNRRD